MIMVSIETAPEYFHPAVPLIPKVDAWRYTTVLRCLGLPPFEINKRRVVISSGVHETSLGLSAATFERRNKLVTLYPGTYYPGYLEGLASIGCQNRGDCFDASQELTDAFHSELTKSLLHEAKHDIDNYRGIDFGELPVRFGLYTAYSSSGVFLSALLTSSLDGFRNPMSIGLALAMGVGCGLVGSYQDSLTYKIDPIEIRARIFENSKEDPQLVDTCPNPNVDLNYVHDLGDFNGSNLRISNRRILELRGF